MVDTSSDALSHTDFNDFVLEVLDENEHAREAARVFQQREYSIRLRSPSGELRRNSRFPFDALELESRLHGIESAILGSGRTRPAVSDEWQREVQEFGEALFEAVLGEPGRDLYYQSRDEAERDDKGLRLKVRLEPSELRGLPWEVLFDARRAAFVGLGPSTMIVRDLGVARGVKPLPVERPLRILGMVACPGVPDPLVVENERRRVENALATLRTDGLVELRWLQGQTWRDLQREISGDAFHVLHFIGHGQIDMNAGEGLIAFADQSGEPHLLPAIELARLLADEESLRLVELTRCVGARVGALDVFSSTAATLVQHATVAVLARQYEISEQAASDFSRSFHEALVKGVPVDAAVELGRQAVRLANPGSLEWLAPSLYQQEPNSVLFSLRQSAGGRAKGQDAGPDLAPEATSETVKLDSYLNSGIAYGDRIIGSVKSMFAAIQQDTDESETPVKGQAAELGTPTASPATKGAAVGPSRRFMRNLVGTLGSTPGATTPEITPEPARPLELLGSWLNKTSTDLSLSAARKWVEDTKGGLRLASTNVRAVGTSEVTWADVLYTRLGPVQICVLYFASRFNQELDLTTAAAMRTFGENTPPSTSVSFWDPKDPEFSRVLALFGLKVPPAVIFVSGLRLKGMDDTKAERAPLYSIAITDEDVMGDAARLAFSANTIHEIMMRGDPREMETYLLQRRVDAVVEATGNLGGQLRDQLVALKPKIGLPGGFSIQLG